ncbi:MAG TPA: metal-sensing transcriptional repressor [Caulobacteraceae bacterium]
MSDGHKHTSHPRILLRLRRAEGHLRSVITMIEQGRSCAELAQQLHAVEAALGSAKRELIHDHIENCLEAPAGESDAVAATLQELKLLTKYL